MQWEEFQFHIRHLSQADQASVERAFRLGSTVHEGQKRRSGDPFFSHPIAVTRMLAALGADRDTIIAGLLHDSVEDTELTLSDIEEQFGKGVAMLIDGVTKLEHVDIADKPHLNEQVETLRKMFTLMQQDVRIMVIKLVDRLHNMQTISFMSPERQVQIARETMDVYVKIADRLCMRDLQDELEALSLSILEPELFARLLELRNERGRRGKQHVEAMSRVLQERHADATAGTELIAERKQWRKIRQQLQARGAHVTGLATVAIAFVCRDVDQCYRVLGSLHQEWQREILSFQDYINSPMINGYRGLHTTVILEDGTRVRCKIRTAEMEEYAHRGVTVSCFDSRARGVLDYLPWTKRIATIATDTVDRSAEFWEGLQSDILGSTIVIHGPDDSTVLVPGGSTVLDGAFFLFGDIALRTKEVRVNGLPASLDQPLANASTLTVALAQTSQAELRWLRFVHTAIASASIRTQLAAAPRPEKITLGRELLDIALQRFMRLRLAEISPSLLLARLPRLGLNATDDLFEDIAEGKLDTVDVVGELFSDFRKRGGRNIARAWVLRAEVPLATEERLVLATRSYPVVRLSTQRANAYSTVTARLLINAQQADDLTTSLSTFLTPDTWSLRRTTTMRLMIAFCALLLVLWGLDPVVARSLLTGSLSPYDLTFVRAVTFFIASALLYGGQLIFSGGRLKRLSPFHPTLVLSGAALFATALFSYLALSGLAATTYILCVIGGTLVTVLFHRLRAGTGWAGTAISLCLVAGAILVAALTLGYTNYSILAAIGGALGFALYSELSRRYQHEGESIRARYPAFLFWMSCVAVALSGLILPFTDFHAVGPWQLVQAVVFALIFSVLPYSLYFEIMRRMDSTLIERASPLVVIVTVAGELLLSNSVAPLIALPLILLFLAQYYGMYRKTVTS